MVSNNVSLSTRTCEDGGADHFALLTPSDSVDADLVLCSRKQAGQGVVGDIAVNHHAVHSTCRRHQREADIRTAAVTLISHFFICRVHSLAKCRPFCITE